MCFGCVSGPVPPVSLSEVSPEKPVYLVRPTIFQFLKTVQERRKLCKKLFDHLLSGKVKPVIGASYSLKEVAIAHTEMESRRVAGFVILRASEYISGV